jgi:hypothetical protein
MAAHARGIRHEVGTGMDDLDRLAGDDESVLHVKWLLLPKGCLNRSTQDRLVIRMDTADERPEIGTVLCGVKAQQAEQLIGPVDISGLWIMLPAAHVRDALRFGELHLTFP